jgi:hypothetical protein
VVARGLRLGQAEGSLRRSGEALHNSVELVSGDGGSVSGDGDDGVPGSNVVGRGRGSPQSSGKGVARTGFFIRSSKVCTADRVMGVGISVEGWFWRGIGRLRNDHGFSSSYGR